MQRHKVMAVRYAADANLQDCHPCRPAVQAAAAVASHAQALVALLDVAEGGAAQETPFGALRPPLGLARLKASCCCGS